MFRTIIVTLVGTALALKVAPKVSQQDVTVESQKLEKLVSGLSAMLTAQDGKLSHSKVAPALKLFLSNLQHVLAEVAKDKDPADALRKLKTAKAGVAGLVSDLTNQQEALMNEDSDQKESLLLGVLLTKQKESMARQLEVLKSPDFANLEVARMLLSNHSGDTPLYVLAATYLDKHRSHAKVASNVTGAMGKVAAMADSLDKRVQALEREASTKARHHQKKVEELTKLAKKANASSKEARILKATLKREERDYKKWAVVREHDIQSMKAAAQAVRSGDMKALNRARAALEKSLEALKGQSGGFLVLLSMGHQLLQKDCPYCAAQCVEACHNRGEAYVGCLSECADAGKGF
jgi:hypothetical protein